MISFNTQILNNESKYCIQVETDSKNNFELLQGILRDLVDHKVCHVRVSNNTTDKAKEYFGGN